MAEERSKDMVESPEPLSALIVPSLETEPPPPSPETEPPTPSLGTQPCMREPEPEAKLEPVHETEAGKDVTEEKSIIPQPPFHDSKTLVPMENSPEEDVEEKETEGSINRDTVLAKVSTEKNLSLIKAWEQSKKSKAENKALKKLSAISSWETSKKAEAEAKLRKEEKRLEEKKAAAIERMKNKFAGIHRNSEEKKAIIEAKKGEDLLKAEEKAAKYRATGTAPKKSLLAYFSRWI